MPIDDDDDLFNEEFDLVDDEFEDEEDDFDEDDTDFGDETDDDSSEVDDAEGDEGQQPAKKGSEKPKPSARRKRGRAADDDSDEAAEDASDVEGGPEGEDLDEYGRPMPLANYVVHIYEFQKFKRTIDRPFTPEDAEAFASEYNRTGKVYGRFALSGKNDAKPKKSLD